MPVSESTQVATQVVKALTGARWTWPPVRVIDRYPASDGKVRLAGIPVREVFTVSQVDSNAVLSWAKSGSAFLVIKGLGGAGLSAWCGAGGYRLGPIVEVDYAYGSEPSLAAKRAIKVLADELKLSVEGSSECKLPKRVTSVSRQGVSWTLLDPQDFLDQGRTGIYEVDLLIMAANRGKAKARSRVFSVEYPPPDRRSVTVLPFPIDA